MLTVKFFAMSTIFLKVTIYDSSLLHVGFKTALNPYPQYVSNNLVGHKNKLK